MNEPELCIEHVEDAICEMEPLIIQVSGWAKAFQAASESRYAVDAEAVRVMANALEGVADRLREAWEQAWALSKTREEPPAT